MSEDFKSRLKGKMDEYAHFIYKITQAFPKNEQFGVTSQFRRSSLSVILNYIEGYARRRPAVQLHFFEISYGSLQESKYLDEDSRKRGLSLADEIGAILWSEITSLDKSLKK